MPVDKSLIKRGYVKFPDQELLVPCSEELDIIDSFTEAIMNEKDISDDTKKQIERRCIKDRRGVVYRTSGNTSWKITDNQRRQTDRRGRKSAEDLAEFMMDNKRCHWPSENMWSYEISNLAKQIMEYLNY